VPDVNIRYPVPRPVVEVVKASRLITPVVVVAPEDLPEGQIVTNVNLMSVP